MTGRTRTKKKWGGEEGLKRPREGEGGGRETVGSKGEKRWGARERNGREWARNGGGEKGGSINTMDGRTNENLEDAVRTLRSI